MNSACFLYLTLNWKDKTVVSNKYLSFFLFPSGKSYIMLTVPKHPNISDGRGITVSLCLFLRGLSKPGSIFDISLSPLPLIEQTGKPLLWNQTLPYLCLKLCCLCTFHAPQENRKLYNRCLMNYGCHITEANCHMCILILNYSCLICYKCTGTTPPCIVKVI